MAYTLRRASRAMFVTSSTTCVAFLANFFSPIMPIKAFGIYAAIIIPANFILVCIIFPDLIVYDEQVVSKKFRIFCECCSCCFSRRLKNYQSKDTLAEENEGQNGDEFKETEMRQLENTEVKPAEDGGNDFT